MDDLGILASTTQGKLSHFASKMASGKDQLCVPVSTTQGKMSFLRVRPCSAKDQLCIPTVTTEGSLAWMRGAGGVGSICISGSTLPFFSRYPAYGLGWRVGGEWVSPPEAALKNTNPTLDFMNGEIYSVLFYKGLLYVVGTFTSWQGDTSKKYIIRLNSNNEWEVPYTTAPNLSLLGAKVIGDNLYVIGNFTTVDGVTVNRIAKYDGTTWTALGAGLGAAAYCLTQWGNLIVVGGGFTTAGGGAAARIASWDGANWAALGAGLGSLCFAVESFGGNLIAGGIFTSAGGSPCARIGQWDGANWSEVGNGVDGEVDALLSYDGKLLVGGQFTAVSTRSGSQASKYFGVWSGTSWSAFGSDSTAQVRGLATGADGDALILTYSASISFTTAKPRLCGVSAFGVWTWNGNSIGVFDGDSSHGFAAADGTLFLKPSTIRSYAFDGIETEIFAGGNSSQTGTVAGQGEINGNPGSFHLYDSDSDVFTYTYPSGATAIGSISYGGFWLGGSLYIHESSYTISGTAYANRIWKLNEETGLLERQEFANSYGAFMGMFHELDDAGNESVVLYGRGGNLFTTWPTGGAQGPDLGGIVRFNGTSAESWSNPPNGSVNNLRATSIVYDDIGGVFLVSNLVSGFIDKYGNSGTGRGVFKVDTDGDWVCFTETQGVDAAHYADDTMPRYQGYFCKDGDNIYYCEVAGFSGISLGPQWRLWLYAGGSWTNLTSSVLELGDGDVRPYQMIRHPKDGYLYLTGYYALDAGTKRHSLFRWSGSGNAEEVFGGTNPDAAVEVSTLGPYNRHLYALGDNLFLLNLYPFIYDLRDGGETLLRRGRIMQWAGADAEMLTFQGGWAGHNSASYPTFYFISDAEKTMWPVYDKPAF